MILPETKTVTSNRFTPLSTSEMLHCGRIQRDMMAMNPDQIAAFDAPPHVVDAAIWRLRTSRHQLEVTRRAEHAVWVRKISGGATTPKDTPEPAGRPINANSLRARLMSIEVGATVVWDNINTYSLQTIAARIRALGDAAFQITASKTRKGVARIRRVDDMLITDGHGNTKHLRDIQDKSPWPFHYMTPGDRFTASADLHTGIDNMRSTCSKFSKSLGHQFTAAIDTERNIAVTCNYRPGTWVSERRLAEVKQKLKSQAPQVISEIFE